MCGIVGYLGPQNPKDVLIQGLKTLEYRGYDSAGIAVLNGESFSRVRAEGKLVNLQKKLEGKIFDGHLGIGHTRWATHGGPTERNAHPHMVDGVCVVHNGIIENYQQIRDELESEAIEFSSETDTELIAHLISKEVTKTNDLFAAVQRVVPGLKGAFAVVAIWESQPDTMVAFRNGPPLVVGVGEGESIVASDIQAVVAYTRNVIYLEDLEIAHVKGTECKIFSADGAPIEKEICELDWTVDLAEKQGYPHFMLKEIYEQPRAVANALQPHICPETNRVNLTGLGFSDGTTNAQEVIDRRVLEGIERIFIVACGTSFYAGMAGEYVIEDLAGIPVEMDIASEFRYRKPALPKNSLVIFITQSGETADTLASLRIAKEAGVKTLCICNVKNSSIDRESDAHIFMNAGTEVGVASTKAFTATLSLLNIFAIYLGKILGRIDQETEQGLVRDLLAVPSQMEKVLAYNTFFAEAAKTLKSFRGFLYIGRGVSYPIALEGALKLKELAYMHAEGYAAGEMKHGPIALIDEEMAVVVVAPDDELYDKTVSNLEQLRARGGQVISIGTEGNEKLTTLSKHYLSLPKSSWINNSILAVIPLQLLAYHVSDALGYDVDQPRNLAKSVTVE
jgi:glucosamine--fructose-6-phosphate aminotransferase (isomerizing)